LTLPLKGRKCRRLISNTVGCVISRFLVEQKVRKIFLAKIPVTSAVMLIIIFSLHTL
jgi:hypothetical protein